MGCQMGDAILIHLLSLVRSSQFLRYLLILFKHWVVVYEIIACGSIWGFLRQLHGHIFNKIFLCIIFVGWPPSGVHRFISPYPSLFSIQIFFFFVLCFCVCSGWSGFCAFCGLLIPFWVHCLCCSWQEKNCRGTVVKEFC